MQVRESAIFAPGMAVHPCSSPARQPEGSSLHLMVLRALSHAAFEDLAYVDEVAHRRRPGDGGKQTRLPRQAKSGFRSNFLMIIEASGLYSNTTSSRGRKR